MNFVGTIQLYIFSYIIVLKVLREGLVADDSCNYETEKVNAIFNMEVSKNKKFLSKIVQKMHFSHSLLFFFPTAFS